MIFDGIIRAILVRLYIPPIWWPITAHLFPSSLWRFIIFCSRQKLHSFFGWLVSSWLVYLNVEQNTSNGILWGCVLWRHNQAQGALLPDSIWLGCSFEVFLSNRDLIVQSRHVFPSYIRKKYQSQLRTVA